MPKPSRQQYPVLGPDDPLVWDDVRSILDTHALQRCRSDKGRRSLEAKTIRALTKTWEREQGLDPTRVYAMPLRGLAETISRRHRDLIALHPHGVSWAVVVNAINDPHGGLQIVERPYARRRTAA